VLNPPCPVCASHDLVPFLRRHQVPVHQNLVTDSQAGALAVTRGELDLVVCTGCGFVFNRAFDLSLLSYNENYDNSQTCSSHFDAYLDWLVEDLVEHQGVRHSRIVEVGCGKGHFLHKLVSYPGADNSGFGFDPSYIGATTLLDGRLRFRRCYYDGSCTDVMADVVVCRHVIEHVPEPLSLLRSVRAALAHTPQARVFFETPCVDWILRNQVGWDLFYEHCSLFSAASLQSAFEQAGFAVERVTHTFGGQYLWLEARLGDGLVPTGTSGAPTVALARAFAADNAARQQHWLTQLHQFTSRGKVAIWGAAAKGATLAHLIDPQGMLIDCVVDLNPNKQGCYLPGTGHLIVAPAELARRGVKTALLMNPNYRNENLALLSAAGSTLNLVDWNTP
jgi:2-polyprenyl-3-methyl-5-hydroxy-6-metoxy-1,4-benzoquinol methylase